MEQAHLALDSRLRGKDGMPATDNETTLGIAIIDIKEA
jgi:hypothetical protein